MFHSYTHWAPGDIFFLHFCSPAEVPDPLLADPRRNVGTAQRSPPPIPTRPTQQYGSSYNSYGSGYGSYGGLGGYGGYGGGYGGSMYGSGLYGSSMYGSGMYGGTGGYYGGGMYGRMGGPEQGYNPNSFVRQAEESSRQAFSSIESIVHAVGSVAMMLESTFAALYNSFRAVIGVADHFSRMKMHFGQIFSALAVIRTMKWLYRKLLVLLRLRAPELESEIWNEAAQEGLATLAEAEGGGRSKSSWPIIIFFGMVIGGPWLIWKLLSSLSGGQG